MSDSFWSGRRVFLTGHTGFKGSWLSLWLHRLGAQVTGYALAPHTDPSLFESAGVASCVTSVLGDIRERAGLDRALGDAGPEVVFHLAAQPIVRESIDDPVETFNTNVLGTVQVLDAVRHAPSVRAVVVVTSDKCYENRERAAGYVESDPMGGDDPYSASKGCAELVAASFRTTYFRAPGTAAVASARAGNVIGGGDWAKDRLVPDIVTAFQQGEPARIRYPEAVRPWQHVLDPLHGYLLLARALVEGGEGGEGADAGWNFGPVADAAQPVSWICDRMAAAWGAGAGWERDGRDHPAETGCLTLDASRAVRELGWAPRLDLETALAWTVDWYRAFHDGRPARDLCIKDLEAYEQRGA